MKDPRNDYPSLSKSFYPLGNDNRKNDSPSNNLVSTRTFLFKCLGSLSAVTAATAGVLYIMNAGINLFKSNSNE